MFVKPAQLVQLLNLKIIGADKIFQYVMDLINISIRIMYAKLVQQEQHQTKQTTDVLLFHNQWLFHNQLLFHNLWFNVMALINSLIQMVFVRLAQMVQLQILPEIDVLQFNLLYQYAMDLANIWISIMYVKLVLQDQQ